MYKIRTEVLQAVIEYLSTKPYKETFNLIDILQKSEVLEVIPEKEED